MVNPIVNRVVAELRREASRLRSSPLRIMPRPFLAAITTFTLNPGKLLRPTLFVMAFKAYQRREPANLYRAALAFEHLHNFILMHDDIIDRSNLRRGRPALHRSFARALRRFPNRRFTGEDLAIVAGDMLYALGLRGFSSIDVAPERRQRALDIITETAVYTACGEFQELMLTLRPLPRVTLRHIIQVYDWKSAYYSFVAPLMTGAILAGAPTGEIKVLAKIGILAGRAFQLRDDLDNLILAASRTGKPAHTDLDQGQRTLPLWLAYRHLPPAGRRALSKLLASPRRTPGRRRKLTTLIMESGAPGYGENMLLKFSAEISRLIADLHWPPSDRRELQRFVAGLVSPRPSAAVQSTRRRSARRRDDGR